MKNFVLIGLPSAGKSTAGVLFAKRIGYDFLDCDLLIQSKAGKLLSEIIAFSGSEGFIRLEEKILGEISADKTIISTGGSAVYGENAMEHLKSLGTVVYLKIGLQEFTSRIGDFTRRGVVMREGISTAEELFKEREPLYLRYADEVICCDGDTIEDTVKKLVALSEKYR